MPDTLPHATPATRRCSRCSRSLPVESFRIRKKDGAYRDWRCRDCHNRVERQRRQAAKLAQVDKACRKISSARSTRRVVALADDLIQKLGGLAAVVDQWSVLLDLGTPGVALRACNAAARMIVSADKIALRRAELRQRRREQSRSVQQSVNDVLAADSQR
jgi:DNA-directed RNA polymerase subunit RPC12/RpoP